MKFTIERVDEQPQPQATRLYQSLAYLKWKMKLPVSVEHLAAEIKRTAVAVTPFWDSNAWADTKLAGDLLQPFIEQTKQALREDAHLKSARAARQLANSIWSVRRNRRGRTHEINPDLLVAVLESVERIAGRKLTYSRKRLRRAPQGTSGTGPAEGAMLDALLAALDWAYALRQRESAPFKREGVLSAIKRLRRSQGQN